LCTFIADSFHGGAISGDKETPLKVIERVIIRAESKDKISK